MMIPKISKLICQPHISIVAVVIGVWVFASAKAAEKNVKITGEMMGPMGLYAELQTCSPPPKEFITVTHVPEGSPAKLLEGSPETLVFE